MSSYVVSVLTSACISGIAAISLALIINFSGRIALSHGVMLGLGSYSYALLIDALGWSAWVALIFSPLLAMVIAALLAALIGRMEVHVVLIATLALQFVGHEVFKRWDGVTNGDAGLTGIVRPLAMSNLTFAVFAVLALLVVSLSLHWYMKGSWGLKLRALREDPEAAASAGLSVDNTLLVTFLVSGGVAGFAGALHAGQVSYIVPDSFGLHWSLILVVMCMAGGANVIGVGISAVALVTLPEIVYSTFDLPSQAVGPLQDLVYGAILVGVMLFRPAGLFPELHLKRSVSEQSGDPRVSSEAVI